MLRLALPVLAAALLLVPAEPGDPRIPHPGFTDDPPPLRVPDRPAGLHDAGGSSLPAGRTHRVFFADTDYELNVYQIKGREPGATLLLIGGIHGDEPGGYLAADLYADLTLRRGNLIVVPRANVYSIQHDERGSHGDMNRKFTQEHDHELDVKVVGVLKQLMGESDGVLNLHDGTGFYRQQWVDATRNPLRWGQSVIIDTDTFTDAQGRPVDLAQLAGVAVAVANRQIPDPEHHFRVNNTRTYSDDSPHREQRGSATYFAVSDLRIPAFGVETSKEIGDESVRVSYQVQVINAFLEQFGIVPDHPRFALEPPKLRYLAVSIEGAPPVVVEDGERLPVPRGARFTITHVEANYQRGLAVDVIGLGGINDLGRSLVLDRDHEVLVRKDKYTCGRVELIAEAASPAAAPAEPAGLPGSPREVEPFAVEAFRVAVNGTWGWLAPGATLRVVRGDHLELGDPLGPEPDGDYQINFRGFVGNPLYNDAEDRGYTIRTEADLMPRFSLSPQYERYELRAERGPAILTVAVIDVVEPKLDYVLLAAGSGPATAVAAGDTLTLDRQVPLRLIEPILSPREVTGVAVLLHLPGSEQGRPVRGGEDLARLMSGSARSGPAEVRIVRRGVQAGSIWLRPAGASPHPR